jgi:hypothetical protein
MPAQTYRNLSVESLYELLVIAVRDMLAAHESNKDDAEIAFNAMKKQVEILMDLIEEKRQVAQ